MMTTTWNDCMAVEAETFAQLEAQDEAYYLSQQAYSDGMAAARNPDTFAAVPDGCADDGAWIDGFCDALEMALDELMEVGR